MTIAIVAGATWMIAYLCGYGHRSWLARKPPPPKVILCDSVLHSEQTRRRCEQMYGHEGKHRCYVRYESALIDNKVLTWDNDHTRAWDEPRVN